eukprot:EG_transcript_52320
MALVARAKAMFAVIHMTAHQYKVSPGDLIQTEKVLADIGETIRLKKVLLVGTPEYTAVGQPLLENAAVLATVEEHVWTEKTDVFKRKRRTGYRRWKDHRQDVTHLRIVDIVFDPPADP